MKGDAILYVVTQADRGGAQKYVAEMAHAAVSAGFEVTVAVGQSTDRSLVDTLKDSNTAVVELRHLVRPISPIHDILAVFELWLVCRRLKPTIIHLNSSKAGVVGSITSTIAKITGTKHRLIYTVHGWSFMESGGALKKLTYLVCEWLTAPLKDYVIYIAQADEHVARNKHFFIRNSMRIPNGIDTTLSLLSRTEARTRLRLTPDSYIVGTIANFYATKGLSDFIITINHLRQTIPNVLGVIIGDGPLRPQLEAQIEQLQLKNHIKLLGKKENARQYLPALDLYLSTSHKEGFPYTILEAMHAQLPIIATRAGAITEIIHSNKNGVTVPISAISEIVSAITHYHANPEIAEVHGKQTSADVTNLYSLEKSTAETLKCYL